MVGLGLGALIELGRDIVIARSLGATAQTDAFFTAFTLPFLVTSTILGSASVSFTPYLTEQLVGHGRAAMWSAVEKIIGLVLVIAVIICTALIVFAESLIGLIAPGLSLSIQSLATSLLRILSVTVIFSSLSMIASAVLNSLDHYLMPALLRAIRGSIVILLVLGISRLLGVTSLAIGFAVAAPIELIFLALLLVSKGYKPRFSLDICNREILCALRDGALPMLGSLIRQSSKIVERILASALATGTISMLDYSSRWAIAVSSILGASGVTGALPLMSRLAAKQDTAGLLDLLRTQFRMVSFLAVPATVAFLSIGRVFIEGFYIGGAFTKYMGERTALLLAYYSLGILFFTGAQLLSSVFYALRKPQVPFVHMCLMTVVNIVLDVVLVRQFGAGGIALAFSATSILSFLRLLKLVSSDIGWLFDTRLTTFLLKIGVASSIMGLMTWYVSHLLEATWTVPQIARLPVLVVLGSIVFGSSVWLLRLDGLGEMMRQLKHVF